MGPNQAIQRSIVGPTKQSDGRLLCPNKRRDDRLRDQTSNPSIAYWTNQAIRRSIIGPNNQSYNQLWGQQNLAIDNVNNQEKQYFSIFFIITEIDRISTPTRYLYISLAKMKNNQQLRFYNTGQHGCQFQSTIYL